MTFLNYICCLALSGLCFYFTPLWAVKSKLVFRGFYCGPKVKIAVSLMINWQYLNFLLTSVSDAFLFETVPLPVWKQREYDWVRSLFRPINLCPRLLETEGVLSQQDWFCRISPEVCAHECVGGTKDGVGPPLGVDMALSICWQQSIHPKAWCRSSIFSSNWTERSGQD